MKGPQLFPASLLLLLLALPSHGQAQGFEGSVTVRQINVSETALAALIGEDADAGEPIAPQRVFAIPHERILALTGSDGVETDQITYHIKGNKLRVDGGSAAMPGYAIMDWGAGEFQLVSPGEQVVMELTKEDFEEIQKMYPEDEGEAATARADVRPLDRSKEINGMRCSAYEIRSKDAVGVVWVAAELKDLIASFRDFESHMRGMGIIGEKEEQTEVFMLVAEYGFPVLEQTFHNYGTYGGGTYDVSEVVSLERKTVSADLFSVPADFERRSFMDIIRMLGGKPDN